MKITRYDAYDGKISPVRIFGAILKDLPSAHELGFRLFLRDIRAAYRQSFLGFFWAVVPALMTAALWIFLRGSQVLDLQETSVPYPVFVLCGTLLWQTFAEAAMAPLGSTGSNRAMLTKINIPKEGLLLAGFYSVLLNVLIKVLIMAVILAIFRQGISVTILMFPLMLLMLVVAGFAVGLWLLPAGMLFTDIQRAWGMAVPFLMYLAPVVYSRPADGPMNTIMNINPLSALISEARNSLTGMPAEEPVLYLLIATGFVLLFFAGLILYRIAMPFITERIGS